jgi:pyrroline-5-carboxylate reductase
MHAFRLVYSSINVHSTSDFGIVSLSLSLSLALSLQMENRTVGIIGAGRIVQALIDGLNEGNQLQTIRLWISSPSATDDRSPLKRYNHIIRTTTSNIDLCIHCDIVLFAVKAKIIKSICEQIATHVDHERLSNVLFVSVVPGLTISTLGRWLTTNKNIMRIMYNVNVANRNGSYAIASSTNDHLECRTYVQHIFDRVAFFAGHVSESELDIMCALIGSGPAFFCTAVEGLADGAVKAGLSRSLANTLAARTMLGCADLLLTSSKHPAVLKDDISTPAGTTIYGLHELEKQGVRAAYMDALMAAFNRAQTMADQLAKELD